MKAETNPTRPIYSSPRGFDVLAGVKEIVGRNIERLMDAKGMSREALATALKTGPSNVSRWIRGAVLPTAENLDAMKVLFDVPLSSLFNEELVDPKRPLSPEEVLELFAASQGYTLKKARK